MSHIYHAKDFKEVIWKNGGGKTLELYRLDNPHDPSSFHFRLSQATVDTSGPFSIFNDIDRILYLVKGPGFNLKMGKEIIKFCEQYQSISFKGEVSIYCDLIGPSTDFNIMIDRQWGKVKSELVALKANSLLEINQDVPCFLYLNNKAPILISIEAHEKYTYQSDSECVIIKTSIIRL